MGRSSCFLLVSRLNHYLLFCVVRVASSNIRSKCSRREEEATRRRRKTILSVGNFPRTRPTTSESDKNNNFSFNYTLIQSFRSKLREPTSRSNVERVLFVQTLSSDIRGHTSSDILHREIFVAARCRATQSSWILIIPVVRSANWIILCRCRAGCNASIEFSIRQRRSCSRCGSGRRRRRCRASRRKICICWPVCWSVKNESVHYESSHWTPAIVGRSLIVLCEHDQRPARDGNKHYVK